MTDRIEQQITHGTGRRILTNCNIWSPDSQWIVYDTRSDAEGSVFDGATIEVVNIDTGEIKRIYRSLHGAHCGVATFHPTKNIVAFILGPENPTPDWQYAPSHRQGVFVDLDCPGKATNIDARNTTAPLTPGALRGGSHLHVFSPDGEWISFTYNDALLARFAATGPDHDIDQRNVGVSAPLSAVYVPKSNARNHDGAYFTVLATRTTAQPRPGSDDITQALEEGWIGQQGYLKPDGTRQSRALAFQGQVIGADGEMIWEVFIVDLPDDITIPSPSGPLEGSPTRRPTPPLGTNQRRVTYTEGRRYPGIQGPRHWLRAAPNGSDIAFLMKDNSGIAQLWLISPNGGEPRQATSSPWPVASAFTWSPDGLLIAYVADNSIFVVEVATGNSQRLTPRSDDDNSPSALACVFSPDGSKIGFMRRLPDGDRSTTTRSNQICVIGVAAARGTDL